MNTRKIVFLNDDYFRKVQEGIKWDQVLARLGIKFKKIKKDETSESVGIFKTRCIFHQDKNPSLTFTKDGWYYCFGCRESGDIFKFVNFALTGQTKNKTKAMLWLKKSFNILLPYHR